MFFNICSSHDWFYNSSDDNSVWRKVAASNKKLFAASEESEKHKEIYVAWHSYVFSGRSFGTDPKPKPKYSDFNLIGDEDESNKIKPF